MINWSVEEGFLMGFIVKGSNGEALTLCPLIFALIKTKQKKKKLPLFLQMMRFSLWVSNGANKNAERK